MTKSHKEIYYIPDKEELQRIRIGKDISLRGRSRIRYYLVPWLLTGGCLVLLMFMPSSWVYLPVLLRCLFLLSLFWTISCSYKLTLQKKYIEFTNEDFESALQKTALQLNWEILYKESYYVIALSGGDKKGLCAREYIYLVKERPFGVWITSFWAPDGRSLPVFGRNTRNVNRFMQNLREAVALREVADKEKQTYQARPIPIDPDRLESHLASQRSSAKRRKPGCIVTMIMLSVAMVCLVFIFFYSFVLSLFLMSGWLFWGIIGVLSLIVALVFVPGMRVEKKKPEEPYDYNVVIPAVIVSTHPIRLVALAEVNTHHSDYFSKVWGATIYQLDSGLPDTKIQVGQRVLCCYSLWGEDLNYYVYQYMVLYPLCQAVSDQKIIAEAETEVEEYEWQRLEKLIPQVMDFPKFKEADPELYGTNRLGLYYFDKEFKPYDKLNEHVGLEQDEISDEEYMTP